MGWMSKVTGLAEAAQTACLASNVLTVHHCPRQSGGVIYTTCALPKFHTRFDFMASPHIAIAKASLAAALFRADVTTINRDSIAEFHKLLENLLSTCSTSNVQKCKAWLLHNVVPSATRAGALGKYLASYGKHAQQDGRGASCKPSAHRKRLHIFYLLNDLFHHVKYHSEDNSRVSNFSTALQPFLAELIQSTAPNCKSKVRSRLLDVLGLWEREEYYPPNYILKLVEVLDTTHGSGVSKTLSTDVGISEAPRHEKELPFVMPSTHGDLATPYFDLPAGNLMPHIIPNSSAAIRPDQVKALQFVPGPASGSLVHALKDFLKEVDDISDCTQAEWSTTFADIDDLGQMSYHGANGEISDGDTYYGWSRTFCDKMKKRKEGNDKRETKTRSYSSSASSYRSRSRSRPKKRRYSDSSSSRSLSRSRSSGSREPRNSRRDASLTRHRSRGYKKLSRSRSNSPNQSLGPTIIPPSQTNLQPRGLSTSQFLLPISAGNQQPSFHVPQNPVEFQPPLGPGGLPLPPPPPPPNYAGPWPPNIIFPPGLPFPGPPVHQGSTSSPRHAAPAFDQNWPSHNWQGNP